MIILSTDPATALGLLSGLDTSLLVEMDSAVRHLLMAQPQYRLAVHTLAFPDDQEARDFCQEIMTEFGFDWQTFPALAIQGLITADHPHPLSNILNFRSPFFLAEPIYDVLPPDIWSVDSPHRLWQAHQVDHRLALTWALQNDPEGFISRE